MNSFLLLALSIASPCFAQSGADALLDQLGERPASQAAARPTAAANQALRGDAFQQQFAVQVQHQRHLSFDVKQWAQAVIDGEYTRAAHLWTSIQLQFPPNFRYNAEAAQLYLLWKLELHQTFIDQWIANLASSDFAGSILEMTLEALVTPDLDAWLPKNAVILNAKQLNIVGRLPHDKSFVPTLLAWGSLRDPKLAEEVLGELSMHNKLTRLLAQSVVYDHVRRGDLKGAARTLKTSVEPAIEAERNAGLLAKHDLSIARILYQAGQMKAAGEFYKKIPNQLPSYLPAREELAWVYIRLGDMASLRGELKALASPLFKDRFQPEVYLLRAVSDLKMCFYDMLEQDLLDFSRSNVQWAKKIDQALTAKTPPPMEPDEYTQASVHAAANLQLELKNLAELGQQSIGAILPAVGQQKHWKDYYQQALAALEDAKKRQSDDYTRQWKNQRSALQEAIRKMRFVKVEYMSQVRQLSASGEIDPKKFVASNSASAPAAAVVKDDTGQLNFAATTEVWSDELFKLRSAAQAQCLKKAGGK